MALDTEGKRSLYWKTGLDNKGLMVGATKTKGIIRNLVKTVSSMDLFLVFGFLAARRLKKLTTDVYKFSSDFQHAMKEVQTISKAVKEDFKGISDEVVKMSTTVPDSAIKLTRALYQIVSAGYDGAKAMDILRISAELAAATVTNTFTAADALTYVMNAYGTAAGTAADISDKLFTIIKLGKVTMEELGPTISMVTGLAAEVGMTFNELAAIYAEAVKKIDPHIVTTGIRGILTAILRVSKGTGESANKARELGIEFDIATLKSKGFKYILNDIIQATKGNEEALMSLFPNVRGLIGLLSVMTNEGENYKKTLDEIENSTGNMKEGFHIMMTDTENQLAIFHNNVTAKLKSIGDALVEYVGKVAKAANDMFNELNKKQEARKALAISQFLDLNTKLGKQIRMTVMLRGGDAAEKALKAYGIELEGLGGHLEVLYKSVATAEYMLKIKNTILEKLVKTLDIYKEKVDEVADAEDDAAPKNPMKRFGMVTRPKLGETLIETEFRVTNGILNTRIDIYKLNEKWTEEKKESLENEVEKVHEIADIFWSMQSLVRDFDSDLANAIGKIGLLTGTISQMLGATSSMDLIAGGMGLSGTLIGLFKTIGEALPKLYSDSMDTLASKMKKFDSDSNKYVNMALTDQVKALERLDKAIDNAYGERKVALLGDYINTLKKQEIEIATRIMRASTGVAREEAIERQRWLLDTIKETTQSIRDIFTGTDLPSLADSIIEGFQEGFRVGEMELRDFVGTFEDLMRGAITEAFEQKLITKWLDPFYKEFGRLAAGGNELNVGEIAILKDLLLSGLKDAQILWDSLQGVLTESGIDPLSTKSETGISGAISGITERTAGLIEGQFNAMRMTEVKMLGQLININDGKLMPSLNALKEIRDNTYNLSSMLHVMNDIAIDTSRIASNTEHLESIDDKLNRLPTRSDWGRVLGA